MSDTITVTINEKSYEVPAGLTILQATERLGIPVPYFCWHKHLSISGNCRMCLVEAKPGPPKPVIACATPLQDGMEVKTDTDRIKRARRAVMEFLLANHPLDCPVCDEAYECKFQDYSYAYGPSESRFKKFHDKKRVFKRENLGKLFVEMNRCIHCTRCVRFLKEVAGEHELERMYRGHNLKIDTYKKAFESPFALNTADLCPVGALEDRKFRFSVRCWNIRRTPSICPSCSIGCNIDIDVFENRIKRLLPRENEKVNACWLCDYGRQNFDFVQQERPDRVLIKTDTERAEATYEQGIEAAVSGLKEIRALHGAEAIGLLLSPWMTNEELFAAKRLGALLGAKQVGVKAGFNHRPVVPVMSDILPKTMVSDDKSPNSTGARVLGLPDGEESFTFAHRLLTAIEDGQIKGLVLFHEDLVRLEGFSEANVRKAMALLDFLLVIGSRPMAIASQAHVFIPTQAFAEKRGTFTNHYRRVQKIRRALVPPGGVRDELSIISDIGRGFDESFGFENAQAAFAAMCEAEAPFSALDWRGVGKLGLPLAD